jgi:hypothetical protein
VQGWIYRLTVAARALGWHRRLSPLITVLSLLSGCTLGAPTANPPAPTIAPVNTGWETLAPGFERRMLQPNGDGGLVQLLALRIDPTLYTLRAHYRPGDPLTLAGWRDALPGAVAFVNANFFDAARQALGLVVTDGAAYGQSFVNMGGMVEVRSGYPRLRSLANEPYSGEALEQAVQGFPMLVINGQPAFTNPQGDRASRRTVVGQDTYGRILLISTPSLFGIKLVDLSAYLPTADLNLVTAVNLDGGGSTLLWIAASPYQIYSFDPVPAILAVYPR